MTGQAQCGDGAARRDRAAVGWLWRALAAIIVGARYLILVAWIAAAAAVTLYLPPLATSSGVGGLIPSGAPALRASYDAARIFGLPLTAQVALVQRDPRRFPLAMQKHAARQAAALDTGHAAPIPGLDAAVPVTNTAGAFPGSRERSTTIITFLYFHPGTSIGEQTAGGRAFARRFGRGGGVGASRASAPADHLVGVTGAAPAQDAQGSLILRYLPWVELATLAAIAVIVGWHFRSFGAPLATLLCVAVAYLVAVRVVALAARRTGATLSPDLEPVLVVLLLGVTTDYSVFFRRHAQPARRGAAPSPGGPAHHRGVHADHPDGGPGGRRRYRRAGGRPREHAGRVRPGACAHRGDRHGGSAHPDAGSWPGRAVPPVHRFSGSPAAEDLHGTVVHRD